MVKNLPANAGEARDVSSVSSLGRFPWRRKWQPTPVLLPGKFHGHRRLAGYSPWSLKDSDMTEHACMHVPCIYKIITSKGSTKMRNLQSRL